MASVSPHSSGLSKLPSHERLAFVVDTMRELSSQRDPQKMVSLYGQRVRQIMPSDGFMSLSRRNLRKPQVRITRSNRFDHDVNPWKQSDLLPVFEGGLLSELIYGDEPRIINDLDVSPDDPAYEFLADHGSLVAVPLYDNGEAINMVVLLRRERDAWDPDGLPEHVWLSNLFGRATNTLVLSHQVKEAYEAVDRELKAVGDIQRSLLPSEVPDIRGLDVAAFYQTSRRAGGDYYDFFPLADEQWGILLADVSGHGTPAAVLMAITHSIAHTCGDPTHPPSNLLSFVNTRLAGVYTNGTGNFVTAFYGIWNPRDRSLHYCLAGHPPPRIRQPDGHVRSLDGHPGLPLGILPDESFPCHVAALRPGETLLLYTDGVTEARNPGGKMYDLERLDDVLAAASGSAEQTLAAILESLDSFADGRMPDDDRTLLVARSV